MLKNIINLLYPAFCQICGKKSLQWDQYLCSECLKKIKKRLPPFCAKCGKHLIGHNHPQQICSDCEKNSLYFDRASSVFYYNSVLRKLVSDFKYKKILMLSKAFVEGILEFVKKYDMGKKIDLVSSVPMHPSRLFRREINPSHILAKDIAGKLGLPYSAGLLKKTKNTPYQSKLSRLERLKNIKDSFLLQKKSAFYVKNKNILLVDDLFTTGSTVNECAKVLKHAGASYVEVITLARGDTPL